MILADGMLPALKRNEWASSWTLKIKEGKKIGFCWISCLRLNIFHLKLSKSYNQRNKMT